MINNLLEQNLIPVIAPIASGEESGHPGFNVNADSVASSIAIATKAKRAIFLTDTRGVLGENKEILESLKLQEAQELITRGWWLRQNLGFSKVEIASKFLQTFIICKCCNRLLK